MPRRDGTGPIGNGPGTGRGLGRCKRFESPGYTGRRFQGRCRRRRLTREEEIQELKDEKEDLEKEIKAIKEKINRLEKEE